jgi:hypothetical protein
LIPLCPKSPVAAKPLTYLGRVAGSAYTVNLYPNPTAPLTPLCPKSPVAAKSHLHAHERLHVAQRLPRPHGEVLVRRAPHRRLRFISAPRE